MIDLPFQVSDVEHETCSVESCSRAVLCRGVCSLHYDRMRRLGSYELPGPPTAEDVAARFWAKVKKTEGCWYWTSTISRKGYGNFTLDGATQKAHRIAYELAIGPIPEGMQIDHKCHNEDLLCPGGDACVHRRCVNPEHLEPVTNRENQARKPRPSRCPQGHPYAETGWVNSAGYTQCRWCMTEKQRAYRRRRKEMA